MNNKYLFGRAPNYNANCDTNRKLNLVANCRRRTHRRVKVMLFIDVSVEEYRLIIRIGYIDLVIIFIIIIVII